MLKSFKYEFLEELEYDRDGGKVVAEYIEIKAPSNSIRQYITPIECSYRKAADDAGAKLRTSLTEDQMKNLSDEIQEEREKNKAKAEDAKKDDPNEKLAVSLEIANMMLSNLDYNSMNKIYNCLDMILKNSGMIDGITKFGGALFDKMSPLDTKYILGEYIGNFFIVSPQV